MGGTAVVGGTVAGLTFLPPRRSSGELEGLRADPAFVLVPGVPEPDAGPVAALRFDRGSPVTVLYSHANAEDLLDVRGSMETLSEELNVNVLGYDYHGYGLSGGACGEGASCRAARACLAHLLEQGVDRGSVVLMGRSLGTGPTVDLAAGEPGLSGAVLQSPLLSVLRTQLSDPVVRAMHQADLFDNSQKICDVACPVFVIHGTADRMVPREHGEELCRLAPNAVRPWWVEGYSHNNLHHHEEYYRKLAEFLQFATARQERRWRETAAAFTRSGMVLKRPSKTKLVLTAL